ncbi:MAG TPA: hypothetical protein VFQ44_13310 [Streptosporangiaceae bacterium]|nr:hypothetical protein [Streptosporangiaceae bacterium]
MVVATAVLISRRLSAFPCGPVVGLLDAFCPLRRWIPVWFGPRLAFMPLHDDRVEVCHYLFLDIGGIAADAAQGDQVSLGVRRFRAGQHGSRIERAVLPG